VYVNQINVASIRICQNTPHMAEHDTNIDAFCNV